MLGSGDENGHSDGEKVKGGSIADGLGNMNNSHNPAISNTGQDNVTEPLSDSPQLEDALSVTNNNNSNNNNNKARNDNDPQPEETKSEQSGEDSQNPANDQQKPQQVQENNKPVSAGVTLTVAVAAARLHARARPAIASWRARQSPSSGGSAGSQEVVESIGSPPTSPPPGLFSLKAAMEAKYKKQGATGASLEDRRISIDGAKLAQALAAAGLPVPGGSPSSSPSSSAAAAAASGSIAGGSQDDLSDLVNRPRSKPAVQPDDEEDEDEEDDNEEEVEEEVGDDLLTEEERARKLQQQQPQQEEDIPDSMIEVIIVQRPSVVIHQECSNSNLNPSLNPRQIKSVLRVKAYTADSAGSWNPSQSSQPVVINEDGSQRDAVETRTRRGRSVTFSTSARLIALSEMPNRDLRPGMQRLASAPKPAHDPNDLPPMARLQMARSNSNDPGSVGAQLPPAKAGKHSNIRNWKNGGTLVSNWKELNHTSAEPGSDANGAGAAGQRPSAFALRKQNLLAARAASIGPGGIPIQPSGAAASAATATATGTGAGTASVPTTANKQDLLEQLSQMRAQRMHGGVGAGVSSLRARREASQAAALASIKARTGEHTDNNSTTITTTTGNENDDQGSVSAEEKAEDAAAAGSQSQPSSLAERRKMLLQARSNAMSSGPANTGSAANSSGSSAAPSRTGNGTARSLAIAAAFALKHPDDDPANHRSAESTDKLPIEGEDGQGSGGSGAQPSSTQANRVAALAKKFGAQVTEEDDVDDEAEEVDRGEDEGGGGGGEGRGSVDFTESVEGAQAQSSSLQDAISSMKGEQKRRPLSDVIAAHGHSAGPAAPVVTSYGQKLATHPATAAASSTHNENDKTTSSKPTIEEAEGEPGTGIRRALPSGVSSAFAKRKQMLLQSRAASMGSGLPTAPLNGAFSPTNLKGPPNVSRTKSTQPPDHGMRLPPAQAIRRAQSNDVEDQEGRGSTEFMPEKASGEGGNFRMALAYAQHNSGPSPSPSPSSKNEVSVASLQRSPRVGPAAVPVFPRPLSLPSSSSAPSLAALLHPVPIPSPREQPGVHIPLSGRVGKITANLERSTSSSDLEQYSSNTSTSPNTHVRQLSQQEKGAGDAVIEELKGLGSDPVHRGAYTNSHSKLQQLREQRQAKLKNRYGASGEPSGSNSVDVLSP